MSQQDYNDIVVVFALACALIIVLIVIIRKWQRIAKKAIKDLGKAFELNESFIGCHFFIHSFYAYYPR